MAAGADRAALIQGASRGIGLEMVRLLLARPEFGQVVATCRNVERSEALLRLAKQHPDALIVLQLDVTDEATIERAAEAARERVERLHLLVNCAGVLHEPGVVKPEKRLEHVDPAMLRRVFEVNAFGPLLVAKHFQSLLRHEARAVLANLSARVGSIEDDRIGGWYGYRASKAAQNMFTKNLAIELARRAPRCICVALHPGTVETGLSQPFRGSVPAEKLFTAERAARQLLDVIDKLQPGDSGGFFAWDGSSIAW